MQAERQTVDLTAYPDLVVVYLGMRVRRPRGVLRLFGLGPQIQKSWKARPDGLLLVSQEELHQVRGGLTRPPPGPSPFPIRVAPHNHRPA